MHRGTERLRHVCAPCHGRKRRWREEKSDASACACTIATFAWTHASSGKYTNAKLVDKASRRTRTVIACTRNKDEHLWHLTDQSNCTWTGLVNRVVFLYSLERFAVKDRVDALSAEQTTFGATATETPLSQCDLDWRSSYGCIYVGCAPARHSLQGASRREQCTNPQPPESSS